MFRRAQTICELKAVHETECKDVVSRKDVVESLNDWMSALNENRHHQSVSDLKIIKNDFEKLPSVQR